MSSRRLGIGDLKVVKQTLLKYDRGEIAHIENVMKTEERERKHRRLDRREEELIVEEETTEVTERDLQTTERSEVQRETARAVKSDQEFKAGLDVTAKYGTVTVVATADFATSTSSQQSSKEAAKYARDVTERAVSKVTERTRKVRTTTKLNELEVKNLHRFDNDTTSHVSGIYQWVDKVYSAQVMNYGTRLMYEFIVPEPAALYLHNEHHRSPSGMTVKQPAPLGNLKPSDLDAGTYEQWVAKYNVESVSPPPSKVKLISTCVELKPKGKPTDSTLINKELDVPPGYTARFAWAIGSRAEWRTYDGEPVTPHLAVIVGRFRIITSSATPVGWGKIEDFMGAPDKKVPVSIHGSGIESYVFNIEVQCKRLPAHLEAWQLKTFNAIVDAHDKLQDAYDAAVKLAELDDEYDRPTSTSTTNRTTAETELRRACIALYGKERFDTFDAMRLPVGSGYPEIDFAQAAAEGPTVQFLEQAFEWEQMTYRYYPYFWARKSKWLDLLDESDTDVTFAAFLRAGSARVVVPVRPGYEAAVAYYEQTGVPFVGGTPPIISDLLYVSIITEIKSKTNKYATALPEGEPWTYRVPTTLVVLPGEPLPDYSATAPGSG